METFTISFSLSTIENHFIFKFLISVFDEIFLVKKRIWWMDLMHRGRPTPHVSSTLKVIAFRMVV
jgi:hypothetical protein